MLGHGGYGLVFKVNGYNGKQPNYCIKIPYKVNSMHPRKAVKGLQEELKVLKSIHSLEH